MICPNCQHENEATANFCAHCGAKLERVCPNCGLPSEPSANFCANCGYSLDRPSTTGQKDSQKKPDHVAAKPSSTIPSHLAKRILRDRSAISGERRTVTVLFVDTVGSTALGEQLDAEEIYSLTQDALRHMMEAVYMYEGHVAQFRGDGIMALFGAPIAHEDTARRAIGAALEMQRSLGNFALEVEGRLDEAEEHFLVVEQVIRYPQPQDHYSLWRYSQHHFHSFGELWLVRGEPDKALAYADECLALAEDSNSRKNIAKGRRLRGQAFLAQGQLEEAGRELSIALEVAQQIGNPTQLWKTHATKGDLHTAQERFDDAENAYLESIKVIQQIADNLTDQALRETFLASDAVQTIMVKTGSE